MRSDQCKGHGLIGSQILPDFMVVMDCAEACVVKAWQVAVWHGVHGVVSDAVDLGWRLLPCSRVAPVWTGQAGLLVLRLGSSWC